MSEITKLYENVGIEKIRNCKGCEYEEEDICPDNCSQQQLEYPPFTAEKQIALIKLLSYYYNITISKNFENDYTFQCEGDDVRRYVFTSGQDFAEQLASFVNMCYEFLPEEEQQQLKEILE